LEWYCYKYFSTEPPTYARNMGLTALKARQSATDARRQHAEGLGQGVYCFWSGSDGFSGCSIGSTNHFWHYFFCVLALIAVHLDMIIVRQLPSVLGLHKNFSKSLPTVAWFGKNFCSQSHQLGFEGGKKMPQDRPICGHNSVDGRKWEHA
jgi:hypothetical protein